MKYLTRVFAVLLLSAVLHPVTAADLKVFACEPEWAALTRELAGDHADITTATRQAVVAVPIPAVAVRELLYDANGQMVKEPRPDKRRRATPDRRCSAIRRRSRRRP